jgi:hypothetical protein
MIVLAVHTDRNPDAYIMLARADLWETIVGKPPAFQWARMSLYPT